MVDKKERRDDLFPKVTRICRATPTKRVKSWKYQYSLLEARPLAMAKFLKHKSSAREKFMGNLGPLGELAAEIVLYPFDIVFPEVCTRLNFNKNHFLIALVAHPMKISDFYRDCLAWSMVGYYAVKGDFGLASHEIPMFGSFFMALIGEPFSRGNPDTFHFKFGGFLQNFISTPGSGGLL